jgi:transposase-like protein
MGRKKISSPPQGRKANKINMVAAAVEIAGGPTVVARLCGVRRQSIYLWIKEWRVERLVDALKLSRASGIPIEKFAGEVIDAQRSKDTK